MNPKLLPNKLAVTIGFSAVAQPKPGMGLSEAREHWLSLKDDQGKESNKILDYGDAREPCLLVGAEKSSTVLYELVPEMCPPGFTIEQAMHHMKAAGFDVRGEGPLSKNGHRTIVVSERSH